VADWLKEGTEPVIFVDSSLQERVTIFNKGEFLESSKVFPDIFYSHKRYSAFHFIIPDSLTKKVKYINNRIDVEGGPETVFFFSSLMPTKRKNVFAIQIYRFDTSTEGLSDGDSLRYASRNYDLFTIQKGQARYLETLSAPEDFFNLPLLKIK